MPEYLSLSNPDWKSVYGHFGIKDAGFRYPGNDLIRPADNVVAIVSSKRERRIGALQWGIVQARLSVTEVQTVKSGLKFPKNSGVGFLKITGVDSPDICSHLSSRSYMRTQ